MVEDRLSDTTGPDHISRSQSIAKRERTRIRVVRRHRYLHESAGNLPLLLEHSPDAVVLIDPNSTEVSWAIVDCNDITCRINGYTREELIGQSIDILNTHPGNPEERTEYLRRIRTAGTLHVEAWHRHKNGTLLPIEVSTSLVNLGGRELVLGIDRDISERRRSEEALEALRRRLQLILDSAGEGIFGLDKAGQTTFVNPAAARMLGWESEELIGRHMHDTVHHSHVDGTPYDVEVCPIYILLKDGIARHVTDEVFWRKDGSSFPVEYFSTPILDEQGGIEGTVLTFIDISERKRSEEALRQSEERFARTFHAGPVPIVITRAADSVIVDVNEAFTERSGFARDEAVGRTTSELGIWANDTDRPELFRMVAERGSVRGLEVAFRTKMGSLRFALCSVEPIYLSGELCMLSLVIDITERKKAEDQVAAYAREQTALLRQLMTIQEAERRRLSMDIHDGPLQSLGVSLMALDRAKLRYERGEHNIAQHELAYLRTNLKGTVDELRAILADLSQEVLGTYGLIVALQSHFDRFSEVTGINVTLHHSIERRLPADTELLMYRLTQETLANIRKHAKAHSVTILVEISDDVLHMTINDDGVGFDVASMYQRYEDGKFMGLKSMYQRIRAAAGDLDISSLPGHGTSLEFQCPLPQFGTGAI
jgi:PAS domain S-box-containing protein